MDILISSILCLSLVLISIQAFLSMLARISCKKRLPPGPKPYPIIGNLLELGDKPHKSLAKLSKSYGPILSLKLGRVTVVVFSSVAAAKEVLQTHDQLFANRAVPDALKACRQGEFGLPWISVSPRWRNLRKICNSHLFSAKILDANRGLRQKKVADLLSDVQKYALSSEAVDIGKAAFRTSLNLLSTTIFSLNLADNDSGESSDMGRELKESVWRIMEEIGKPNLADYFPVLKKIDPQGIRRRSEVHFGKMISLFHQIITQRLRCRGLVPDSVQAVAGGTDNDLLDILINIGQDNSDEMDVTKMERLFVDLFIAGTETSSATLEWSMWEVLNNPKILSKAQAELDQVIGKGNQMEESHITQLPYLQSILKETFRLHPTAPLLLPRKAKVDTKVAGYIIPKGAHLLVNVWAIGRDSAIWKSPEKFIPERFLESHIDFRGQNFKLTPFGAGRRICPGLPLAMRMLHLMLGSLIHSFDWKLEMETHDVNMEDKFGLTLQMAHPLRAIPFPREK